MGVYMDFDRHADKNLPPTEYLLRFGAAVSAATAKANQGRSLAIAMRQWESWKAYALELHDRLSRYEPGSPMLLNTQAPAEPPAEAGRFPRDK